MPYLYNLFACRRLAVVSIIRPKQGFGVTNRAGIGLFHVSVKDLGVKEGDTAMEIESKQSLIPVCGSVDLAQTKLGSARACRAAWNR